VILLRKKHSYLLSQIGNVYQTDTMTGVDKQQCTVMLAITADSNQLSFVILKRKTPPENKFLPGSMRIQERG
jgi:hypothetical protein